MARLYAYILFVAVTVAVRALCSLRLFIAGLPAFALAGATLPVGLVTGFVLLLAGMSLFLLIPLATPGLLTSLIFLPGRLVVSLLVCLVVLVIFHLSKMLRVC